MNNFPHNKSQREAAADNEAFERQKQQAISMGDSTYTRSQDMNNDKHQAHCRAPQGFVCSCVHTPILEVELTPPQEKHERAFISHLIACKKCGATGDELQKPCEGQTVYAQEEPWVAEWREMLDVEYDLLGVRKQPEGNREQWIEAKLGDIRALLEADRKERAGVVVERVEDWKKFAKNYPMAARDGSLAADWNSGYRAALEKTIEIIKDVMK